MTDAKRVVITGLGTANPLGLEPEGSWKAALQGRSGMAPITLFDAGGCPVSFAAEVKGFKPSVPLATPVGEPPITETLPAKDVKKFGRYAQLGIYAGLQAYLDSGLEQVRATLDPERMGVNIGCGMGGLPEIQESVINFQEKGYRRISPFFILQVIPNIISGQLGVQLGLKGPNLCNVTACATSTHSIGESFHLIKQGLAQVMLAGGSESVVCEMGLGGFASMKALSTRNDAPQKASRPFDRDRDGFVLGEGATVLVLEDYDLARRRGARIYGEILGYGASGDGYHLVHPAPEGSGAFQAMAVALAEAGIHPDRLDYANAHATSTPAGDLEEARAFGRMMSPTRERPMCVSSTKSVTGHMLGAAGATEAMFSVLAIRDQLVPPTANLESLDPLCAHPGLDFVAGEARAAKVDIALSNSFGFGGTNGALVFGRV
ncbi:MAG: beta-ketoacyl-ACP synthase II [Holophaga sp.]|nr:beta-ketoacyl-ACP synthase II [Holophaga sp.]